MYLLGSMLANNIFVQLLDNSPRSGQVFAKPPAAHAFRMLCARAAIVGYGVHRLIGHMPLHIRSPVLARQDLQA